MTRKAKTSSKSRPASKTVAPKAKPSGKPEIAAAEDAEVAKLADKLHANA